MKKAILTLSFTLCSTYLILATTPNSATSTDSTRNHASIVPKCNASIVIDGVGDDLVWSGIDAVPIDRKFTGQNPTLYSATWKAFWNDTAIFVLVEVSDDNFQATWMSLLDGPYDRVELYFDVNGTKPDGLGASGIGIRGLYQISHVWDTTPFKGHIQPGYFDSTWEANTWEMTNPANLTTEWCVSFKALKDSNGVQFDPTVTDKIGFDVYIQDSDSAIRAYNKQVWSNIGHPAENWNNMDSCGIITFLLPVDNCFDAVPEIHSKPLAVTPTLASDYINVISEITSIEIIDIMGRSVMKVENNNGIIDISALEKGVFFVRLFSNNNYTGNQKIIKY